MKNEQINTHKMAKMENELGCIFCEDGIFAEMSLDLEHYKEQTEPIESITFAEYKGSQEAIKEAVALVEEEWVQYFTENTPIFCGFAGNQIVSFCIVIENADTILSLPGINVGSIGCVGTIPKYRGRGIGLRMVDLATKILKENGCDKAYISYTHIDKWYERLGYQTFARFSFE